MQKGMLNHETKTSETDKQLLQLLERGKKPLTLYKLE